ncbi:MAG: spore germination protein [Halanaerobiales bacterium]|nr:spore germination protein [Halanaerobiales bacterium]
MIVRLLRKIRIFMKKNFENNSSFSAKSPSEIQIAKNLKTNLKNLKGVFGSSSDLNIREFDFGINNEIKAAVIFIDGLVEKTVVNENIMKPLMIEVRIADPTFLTDKGNLFTRIKKNILTFVELVEVNVFEEIVDGILSGETILLIDGYKDALKIGNRGWEARSIQEPQTEVVVRGPREGFIEALRTNTALIRRKIKSPNLIFESMKIGRVTKTDICIAYIHGIVNDKIVNELKIRLSRIDIDGILESGYIEQLIEDAPFSIFPTIGNSEKPDVVSAKLLEGRVAVITDGTPIVLTLPYIFVEALQSSEDYYSRLWLSTLIRWIRILALLTTIFLPGVYIAAQSYHPEMIPTALLISMAAAREGIPFPAFVEVFVLGLFFEVLREAGIRMPRAIGQAVSIVGALVLGEAAVNAGLVSNPVVMVTAIAGISGFVVPAHSDSVTIMRFICSILATISGLFGIMIGSIFMLIHLASLRSFGVPYLSPLAPSILSDLKDVAIRAPIWAMRKRPHLLGTKNPERLETIEAPHPPKDEK